MKYPIRTMKKTYANVMLAIVAVIWGGGFLATNGALQQISPFYIMMIRFLGASIIPVCICWKKLLRMEYRDLRNGLLAGALLFGAFAFQTFGLKYSSPSKNAFLTATNVVFVPYLLWFVLRRRPNKKEIIASIMCIIGIGLLTLKQDSLLLNIGDVLSLICAVFFALHIISLERFCVHTDAICMTALQMISAGIISAVCALLFEHPPAPLHLDSILNILYLIFISTLLAYLLQTFAQKYTTANSASLILSMEALFASIFSFIFLHEVMSLLMICGACLIFISIIFVEYKPKKIKK